MEKLFGVLFSIYRGTPGHGEWVVGCLQEAWRRLIGDRLASVCRPTSFQGSTLTISVLDRQWEEAVRGVEPELLKKLRSETGGEVRHISVVGPRAQV